MDEALVRHAMVLVDISNEEYKKDKKAAYVPLLAGMGAYRVEKNGGGHNFYAVLDAIHKYYVKKPGCGCEQGFADGLAVMIGGAAKPEALQLVLNYLFYQWKLEKAGNAAFVLDSEALVSSLNETIRKNAASYRAQNSSFDGWFARNRAFAKEHYGVEIG